jgi:ATP-dependent protease HslVU (ClpYQ) peptidase subunit
MPEFAVTTIFADAKKGVMVCESQCTEGGAWFPMTKVHRNGGELIGISGSAKDAFAWVHWYANGKKGSRPKMESFSGLILRAEGLFCVSEDAFEMPVERGFHAVGSGGPCALAAHMAGADAKRAVEIACEIDVYSGGAVIVHKLK